MCGRLRSHPKTSKESGRSISLFLCAFPNDDTVCKRTETAGYRVNLHRFRHAAGTLWSIEDPENIRGLKDLLGHASFDKTTEAHYIISQSRIAGRALAKAIEAAAD